MKNKFHIVNILLISVLFLASCNLPSGQGTTEGFALTVAAQTVEALLSATPTFTPMPSGPATATFTPSPTPTVATNTPVATATSDCNIAQFQTDVTIPDGTIFAPNASFTKKWRIKNIGSCAWNGFSMTFDSGDAMNGPASKPVGSVNPGQEVDLEVNLTAPSTVGNYRGYWRLVTGGNVLVPMVNGYQGKSFYVDIKVQNPVTATFTLPPAIVFAVTSVTFSVTGTCPNFSYTYNITTNGAGTVHSHRIFSDGGTDTLPKTITFASAGTQSFTESVYFGVAGSSSWTDIYIDTPNHQQFGRATFTCP